MLEHEKQPPVDGAAVNYERSIEEMGGAEEYPMRRRLNVPF